MATRTDRKLLRAIAAMQNGSKSGFIHFYNKTFQFVFLQVSRIYRDAEERNLFLTDFYVFLLLHSGEYSKSESVFSWISSQIPLFYESYTGERYSPVLKLINPTVPTDDAICASASIVWSKLAKQIDFPEEKQKNPTDRLTLYCFLAISVLALFIALLAYEKGFFLFPKGNESDEAMRETAYSAAQSMESLDSEIAEFLSTESTQ